MVVNHKPTGRASSMPAGLAAGGAVSLGCTLFITLLLAKFLDVEMISWETIGYYVMGMLLFSSALGTAVSCARIKRQRTAVCFASGLLYFLILMSITALFFGGQYEAVGVTALLVMGGSASAGLLGIKGSRGGKQKWRPRKHR